MRFRLSTLLAGILLLGATVAQAQPRALTRPGKPNKNPPPGQSSANPAAAADAAQNTIDMARVCNARRSVLDTEQKRYETLKVDLVGVDSEMAALQRRMDDLKKRKGEIDRDLKVAETRYKAVEKVYKKDCSAGEDCTVYDVQAASLDQQTANAEVQMELVRSDIRVARDTISKLETSIAPLQAEYAQKKCNNLVPGETEQVVIDRCMVIFSDWNRLQAELNRQNGRVPELKSRYEQLFAELKGLETRAAAYDVFLTKNCTSSAQTAKMKGIGQRKDKAQTVSHELDQMVADLARLRGVKITVTATGK